MTTCLITLSSFFTYNDDTRVPLEAHLVFVNSRFPSYGSALTRENGVVIAAVQYKLSPRDNPAYQFFQTQNLTMPEQKRFLPMRELMSLNTLLGKVNGLRVDKVCTWDPVKLLFHWSDFMDLTVCRTELKLLLPL